MGTLVAFRDRFNGRTVDFLGSVLAAMAIGFALLMDQFRGWGESRSTVLDVSVVQLMFPILIAWFLIAVIELVYGLRSFALLLVHCLVAISPVVVIFLLNKENRLFSAWTSSNLPINSLMTESSLGYIFTILSGFMAGIACFYAISLWIRERQLQEAHI